MVARGLLARPSRLGMATSLTAAVAVLMLCLAFESVVPRANLTPATASYLRDGNSNFRVVILYAATGGFHIFLCAVGAMLLLSRINSETSQVDIRPVVRNLIIAFCLIYGTVLLGCALKLKAVIHSYHVTMLPLRSDPRFGFLFSSNDAVGLGFDIELFALAPLALMFCGIGVAVIACFWISNRAVGFIHSQKNITKKELAQLKRDMSVMISLISTIFTTSTVSTIIFLQMGRDWFVKGPAKDVYIQNGYAMSIFWSCGFSCVIIAMVVVPLIAVKRGRQLREDILYENIHEILSYRFASQAGLAILMPILTSSAAAMLGS